MWKKIVLFEIRYQMRQPLFMLSALVFFALAVALASSDIGTAVGDSPGTALRNAPIVIVRLMPILSLLGLFVMTAFVASSALRDFQRRSEMLFFTKPLGRAEYSLGRFTGSMVVSLLVLVAAVLGLYVASFMPWQPAGRLGPTTLGPYLFGTATIIVPNLLIMGGLFFALALWSRRLTVTYLCVVFFIGMQDLIEVLALEMENRFVGSLLEPSGIVAIETLIRYWTIAEQNSRMPELGGALLANRLLWLASAALVLGLSLARFSFTERERRGKAKPVQDERDGLALPKLGTVELPQVRRRFTGIWRLMFRQTRIELSNVVLSPAFLTLLAIGLMFIVAFGFGIGAQDGLPSYPLTHLMLQAIGLGVRLTLVLILALYAGELVFNSRELKLSEVYDALPVANGVLIGAKLLSLLAITGVFLGVSTAATVLMQLAKGYDSLEPGLYVKGLAVLAWPLVPLMVLALCLFALSGRKLLGLLGVALVLILKFTLPRLGLENHLYLYSGHPPLTYTDLNGYGHHAQPFLWHMAYWSFGALIVLAVTFLFWPRGTERSLAARAAIAHRRLTRPVLAMFVAGSLGMVGVGTWIFHNTSVRNEYLDRRSIPKKLADYERAYAQYGELPLPRITDVYAEVDIFPEARQVEIRGRYRLENTGPGAIRTLPITRSPRWVEGVLRVHGGVSFDGFELPEHKVIVDDDRVGFYVFELEKPLESGEAMDLAFTVSVDHSGFRNRRHNDLIVEDGTFFSNRNFFPFIGYSESNQLLNPLERQKRGMSPVRRAADRDDEGAHGRNYLHADWIRFESIVSTAADQVAVAPGNLEKQWVEGERRFFHYKTSAPVVNLLPFLSGEYQVRRDRWQGVELEIYYHHGFNIDRFMETTKETLAYMSESFGPYPHDQLRIVEIPRYHGGVAFAFAQTIAYSETWAFTADLEGAELDWLTGVLAHEVAHQWWNHQVVPADVQGATLIAETLAQYSAMMVLERMYGPQTVRHFLKFHLDKYLQRRGKEQVREMPLDRVENQGYVHYSKGSLVLYNLKDLVGEETINGALRAFLDSTRFQGPPYADSRELLSFLRRAVPEEQAHWIDEAFETITLFDQRVVDAGYRELPDGTFVVEMETSSTKLRDDGFGTTEEVAMDDWVDIGVFGEPSEGEEESVLLLEKRRLQSRDGQFSLIVDQRPVRAGIDPYNKLIDRNSGDNVRTLTERP